MKRVLLGMATVLWAIPALSSKMSAKITLNVQSRTV